MPVPAPSLCSGALVNSRLPAVPASALAESSAELLELTAALSGEADVCGCAAGAILVSVRMEMQSLPRWAKVWWLKTGVEIACSEGQGERKRKEPGRSAEGPRYPGLSCPPPQ